MSDISRRGLLKSSTALLLASGTSTLYVPEARAATEGTAGDGSAFTFTHPGLLHSAADLARMRSAVDGRQSPVYDGYLALAAHGRSQSAYTVQNTGQITSWGRGPANFMNQAVADSAAAYQNALLWAVTGVRAHADKARDILNAWTASLTMITGADGPLGAGLQVFKFANAAELLRHTGYDGWADSDISRCEESLLDVWYPAVSGYMLYANGNWDLTAIQSILAIGVFCEQRTLFEDALRFAAAGVGNGSVAHRIVAATGQGQESGRDQGHEQLAVGLMGDAAQVAWNQGVDLWSYDSNRILAGAEYAAHYNLGGEVPFTPDLDRTGKYIKQMVSATGRGTLPPIYEMYHAHYAGVRGLETPYTRAAVFRGTGGARVVEGSNDDLPGWGTFTYAGATTPAPTVPAPPAGVTAAGEERAVTVSWLPSASATGYTVLRGTAPEGPFELIATDVRKPTYTDTDTDTGTGVRAGRTYHYAVTAANSLGSSGISAVVPATAGLPGPWSTTDVGAVAIPGSAAFDGERFVLEASGDAESCRLVHLPLRGDGSVTARIVWPLSSQYSKIGVTVRASLDADAAHASMLIQGLPLHTWSGVWTVRPSAGLPVSATGSTPVPPSQQEAITSKASFPISDLGVLPESATPIEAPYVEGAGDGYRLRAPYWVRVTRKDGRCTGSISADGMRWTVVGTTEVHDMSHIAYAGLALTSSLGVEEHYAETGTGAFDNVSVTGASGDVWCTPRPTRTTADLSAASTSDGVRLTWSDPDVSARYTVLRAPRAQGPYRAIATAVGPIGFGTRIRYTDASGTPGTTYHYAVSKTNSSGQGPRSSPSSAVAPVLSAAAARAMCVEAEPLPSPWAYGDLGDVVLDRRDYGTLGAVAVLTPGDTVYDSGTFVVRGSGVDLNVNSQGMTGQFVRRTMSGDGEITARLLSREGTAIDRVGLLMAKSLSPFDQAAGLIVTGGTTAQLMLRPTVAGASVFSGTVDVRLPLLLRLERTGTAFTASVSVDDGATWTALAGGSIPGFGDAPYHVGLVVCSRSPLALGTARFSEVITTSA
ncbi:alginate lyase family protein [Streptomyces sp. NPDC020377]|uniref:alginate lyase family protein n=1 Tax=Streptomyces sp. NPDC020377 TaxID=3365070 RepID=UPI003793B044